jgi:hypothetical protein
MVRFSGSHGWVEQALSIGSNAAHPQACVASAQNRRRDCVTFEASMCIGICVVVTRASSSL